MLPVTTQSNNDAPNIDSKAVLECVQKDALGVDKSESIDKQGVKSLAELFTMTEEDILDLEYDDNVVKLPIKRGQMN